MCQLARLDASTEELNFVCVSVANKLGVLFPKKTVAHCFAVCTDVKLSVRSRLGRYTVYTVFFP